MFDTQKKLVLEREDHSKKGRIDNGIRPLFDLINSLSDYYTTSSCAGRIVLLRQPFSGKKKDAEWLYVTHSKAGYADIKKCLENPPEECVWLRQEPFIIHICARTMGDADKMLSVLRTAGLKHSGILTAGRRIIIEATGTEHMDVPVSKGGALLVDERYLRFVASEANRKLKRNSERLRLLFSKIKAMRLK